MGLNQNNNNHKNNDAHIVALEWIKQIITLSSGIIVLSATFLKTIFAQLNWSVFLLIASWILLLLSIIFGLKTISQITASRINQDDDWFYENESKATKFLFIVGIFLFVIFAIINFLITMYGYQPSNLSAITAPTNIINSEMISFQ
jgi:hypothetical protein